MAQQERRDLIPTTKTEADLLELMRADLGLLSQGAGKPEHISDRSRESGVWTLEG